MDTLISAQISASEYVTQSDLTNLYRDFVTSQADNYSTLFNVLIGVTAVLIGFSLLWNFVISRNQIKNQVKEAVEDLEAKFRKEIEITIAANIDEQSKKIFHRINGNSGDIARLFALGAIDVDEFEFAITHWIKAIKKYDEIYDGEMIRLCVDLLLLSLRDENCPKHLDLDIIKYENNLKLIEEHIPSILNTEKKEILRLFKAKKPLEVPEQPELPFKQ